jgi:hypothetical protein
VKSQPRESRLQQSSSIFVPRSTYEVHEQRGKSASRSPVERLRHRSTETGRTSLTAGATEVMVG